MGENVIQQSPARIFRRFLRFGLMAWGGPIAQIAMIRKELVEEEQWVSKEQFNRALAVYQVLPGPEAQELCVYFGMKAGGRLGGFLAGLGFMLPGFLLMLLATGLYVEYGLTSPLVAVIFGGIQAAVVAMILFAVYRIGKHAVHNPVLAVVALIAGLAGFSGIHFLWILLLAGLAYASWQKQWKQIGIGILAGSLIFITYQLSQHPWKHFNTTRSGPVSVASPHRDYSQVLITGVKGGLLTFGGAYTAIPFIREDAVDSKHWMTNEQFLDGLAISGVLPAPLVIFATFVGYFGGGWPGAVLITIGIFLPAFGFTLIGHHYMERLIANKSLHGFLDGITAGVIGLIAVTALQFLFATINSRMALFILLAALMVLWFSRSRYTAIFLLSGAGATGLIWHLLGGV